MIKEYKNNVEKMNEEELIDFFSYYCSDSEWFVRDNLNQFKEMDHILKTLFKNIKEMEKEYDIYLNETSIHLTNKKTKTDYTIRIEF